MKKQECVYKLTDEDLYFLELENLEIYNKIIKDKRVNIFNDELYCLETCKNDLEKEYEVEFIYAENGLYHFFVDAMDLDNGSFILDYMYREQLRDFNSLEEYKELFYSNFKEWINFAESLFIAKYIQYITRNGFCYSSIPENIYEKCFVQNSKNTSNGLFLKIKNKLYHSYDWGAFELIRSERQIHKIFNRELYDILDMFSDCH